MSWLYSRVLVEEFLEDTSLDGEQSVQSSGSNIPQAYCAPDKMMGFSRLSRFGMMYKPLTESRGEELLMSYLAGFHAKTSQPQEKVSELTENDLECGEKWRGSFTKYDLDSCSWKTHQCSLLGDLDEFSETWPQWGLMRDGECWEQRMLEQTIRGTESGLSPNGVDNFHTPNTTGLDGGSNSRKALRKREEKWPTPATKGYGHAAEGMVGNLIEKIEHGVISKLEAEQMLSLPKLENHRTWKKKFPTPCATDHKGSGQTGQLRDRLDYATERGATKSNTFTAPTVLGGQLNPTWVEWLMGWPPGWTDLKPLEMDKSLFVQQQLGES
jgi:DNA (cytosine-5)-methyltransferase 1